MRPWGTLDWSTGDRECNGWKANTESRHAVSRLFKADHIGGGSGRASGNIGGGWPDGWEWRDLKNSTTIGYGSSSRVLASYYNCWLWSGVVPRRMLRGTTTLIPKDDPPSATDLGRYRPLTVTSVIGRLYDKFLTRRLEAAVPLSPKQKGFRQGDRLFANASILRAIECIGCGQKGLLASYTPVPRR